MKDKTILFVGYGNIGQYESGRLKKLNPDIYDVNKPDVSNKKDITYDFAFIAVPTPTDEVTGLCDISIVEDAVKDTDANIFVIKSTVSIGTTDYLSEKYHKRIVFSPEIYGTTQHSAGFNEDSTILGGDKKDCYEVQQLLQEVYSAYHRFKITDAKTAELSKYMVNTFFATKVNFCNAFWEIANENNISYEDLRECFLMDNRINPSHTFVYDDRPFWDSHCFNKDVPALANKTNNEFVKNICKYNDYLKDKYMSVNK